MLLVGLEPTHKKFLRLSPLPIGLEELGTRGGIRTRHCAVFETAGSTDWPTRAHFLLQFLLLYLLKNLLYFYLWD